MTDKTGSRPQHARSYKRQTLQTGYQLGHNHNRKLSRLNTTNRIFIALAVAVALVAGTLLTLTYSVVYPESVEPGENVCWLGRYRPESDGFDRLEEITARTPSLPAQNNVALFEANLDRDGCVISFRLTLETFNENGTYRGLAFYDYINRTLTYSPPEKDTSKLVPTVNPNSQLGYLDGLVKQIPLAGQIEAGGLERCILHYQPYTMIDADTPLFDGRSNPIQVLAPNDYNAGKGGVSDGGTNVVFRLYDGTSIIEDQQYLYAFEPVQEESATGNQLAVMEGDYAIEGGQLKFTRTHGQSWIETDLSEKELSDTLEFYGTNLALPTPSVFVSADESLPIAYFYGGQPILKITDSGATWRTIPFPNAEEFGRAITRRAVGFTSAQEGFAALGTDWSMGAGEHKMCYLTTDGGVTWTPRALPLSMTSNTLADMTMADAVNGIVLLDSDSDEYFPLAFITTDAGETWQETVLPYDSLPMEVQYLSTADSLSLENGIFTLVMGQGDDGTAKATFTADTLTGPWRLTGIGKETIHTVG